MTLCADHLTREPVVGTQDRSLTKTCIMTATIFAPAMDMTWKVVQTYGVDPEALFKEQGIDARKIADPNARVNKAAINRVWARASEFIDEPGFALKVADFLHPSHLGALGYAWLASTSLKTALNRLSRYVHFVADDVEVGLEQTDDGVVVAIVERGVTRRMPWASDSSLTIVVALCRMNCGSGFNPVKVELQHAKPADSSVYFGFFKCPVYFGCDIDRVTLPVELVDRKLPSANPQLAQLSDQVMIQALARLNKEKIVPRVKAVIIDHLPSGNVSDEQVAAELNMSTRALQRKLHDKGTTFKGVLTEVRQELADKYIRNNQLSLTEISFMLGFSEVSSFSRAFKRWTGESPSDYREAGLSSAAG